MVIVDLKALHHTPIRENRDYVGFVFKQQVYRWRGLPIGWSRSHYYHVKTLRPSISCLRSGGGRGERSVLQ